MLRFLARFALAALFGSTAPLAASAQVRLVDATPAAEARAVTAVTLRFSEPIAPQSASATVVMTGMPGMANHPDMKMAQVKARVGDDRRSIQLTSPRPLPAGDYRVDWSATGADGQRVSGHHMFTVN
jgi:methionine-rich copper-binding protein CopC